MVPANPSETDVTKILYSCTEGKTWETYSLENNNKMKVDGLLNEPGITSLVTNIYGHTSSKVDSSNGGWIIVKLNFTQILSQQCNASEYYTWTPTSGITNHSCLLGQKFVFERRKAEAECFNGQDYERAISVTNCSCLREDFECDYGYELKGTDCVAGSWFDASVPIIQCEFGETFLNSTGYRKIAADKCVEDQMTVRKFDPTNAVCPIIRPQGLGIEVDGGNVVRVNTNASFHLLQERGSHDNTSYTWDFGDGSQLININGLRIASRQVHVYKRVGVYVIKVVASNAKGTDMANIKIWVQDRLSGLYLSVSHAVQVNKPVTFEAVPLLLHGRQQRVEGAVATGARSDDENVHYLWLFGDEINSNKGQLSWLSSATHSYSQPANYTVWVEAFTPVGSAFRTITLPVYGTLVVVKLVLSGLRLPFGLIDTVFEDTVAQSLHKVLTFELGVDETRLDVEFDQTMTPIALVSVLPRQQAWTTDNTIDEIVDRLLVLAQNRSIHFTLPDEAFGANDVITVIQGSVMSDGPGAGTLSKIGLAIGISVLFLVLITCILLLLYYKKRLRITRHYSVLHSRYRDSNAADTGTSLLDDTDDDEPLMDPVNFEASNVNQQQRLTLNDEDDDPLCARIIMSETTGRTNDTDLAAC
jgi:hypothetical protein